LGRFSKKIGTRRRFGKRLAREALAGRFLVVFRRARAKSDLRFVWEKPMRAQGRPFAKRLDPQCRTHSKIDLHIDAESLENRPEIAL
jgi:hypothetical protein